jgi:hypothetical protein
MIGFPLGVAAVGTGVHTVVPVSMTGAAKGPTVLSITCSAGTTSSNLDVLLSIAAIQVTALQDPNLQ